jgi:hypothetical protein
MLGGGSRKSANPHLCKEWPLGSSLRPEHRVEHECLFVPNLIPNDCELLILLASHRPRGILAPDRSWTVLLDVRDHREQIGLDVEAATRRCIIGRFDLGSRRGVAALGMRRAGASSPVIILWHAKCAARRFLAPDNRMRVGVVAQPSFKLYPWRPAILTPVYA